MAYCRPAEITASGCRLFGNPRRALGRPTCHGDRDQIGRATRHLLPEPEFTSPTPRRAASTLTPTRHSDGRSAQAAHSRTPARFRRSRTGCGTDWRDQNVDRFVDWESGLATLESAVIENLQSSIKTRRPALLANRVLNAYSEAAPDVRFGLGQSIWIFLRIRSGVLSAGGLPAGALALSYGLVKVAGALEEDANKDTLQSIASFMRNRPLTAFGPKSASIVPLIFNKVFGLKPFTLKFILRSILISVLFWLVLLVVKHPLWSNILGSLVYNIDIVWLVPIVLFID